MKRTWLTACLLLISFSSLHPQDDPVSRAKGPRLGQPPPGRTPEPYGWEALGNKCKPTRSLTFLPDGTEAYWPVIDRKNDYRRWIVESRFAEGKWSEPRLARFSRLGWEDDVPCISPDGNRLFFISCRPVNEKDKSNKENIWIMERSGGYWGDPRPLLQRVNAITGIHHQLSVDLRGNLYFGADQKRGFGGCDLYCTKFENGEYQTPANLGPVINGSFHENTPFIAPDGSYLIFCKYDPAGWSLFLSFRQKNGGWSVPVALSRLIHIPKGMNTDCPMVTRDGKYLIFFCDDGKSNVPYWVDASFIYEQRTITQATNTVFPRLTGPYLGQRPPGTTPELFAPGIVSTGLEEVSICFSSAGDELFLVVAPPSRMPRMILTSRMVDSVWTEFEEVPFFDPERSNSYPFLTADGKKLYFNAWRPRNEGSDASAPRIHEIWYTERGRGEWSRPEKVEFGGEFKSIGTYPSVSANETIYFSAKHDGDDSDIYRSAKKNGIYSTPEKLSSAVNSPEKEFHSCIARDESYLVFDSIRKEGGSGGQDLYVSFKGSNGAWRDAVNLGPHINSPYADLRPWLSSDGKYLFFISDRPVKPAPPPSVINKDKFNALLAEPGDGATNVYWVDASFIKELKPNE